jgi:hypothetical protein
MNGCAMTNAELSEHLEFVDGIQKAQMLVLRLLLREQPSLKVKLQQYVEQLESNPPAEGLSSIQLQAMKTHLLQLSQ